MYRNPFRAALQPSRLTVPGVWALALGAASSLLVPVTTLAIPRDQALENAAAYATHPWFCADDNLEVECDNEWESDYEVGIYTGLPYMWGGWDSLESFDQKLEEGYGAGSHSWHGILSCVAGQDCSGFLSQVWETGSRYTTSTFYKVATEIDVDSIREADAFNDPGSHMVLHAYLRDDGVPAFYEAAGGPSKVRFTAAASWSYLNGYIPIRYTGIEESTPPAEAGTIDDPIDIRTFPFTDRRNTVMASSDLYDEYACQPGTYERGPEYLYAMDLPRGELTVLLSDASSVDIDVHLMTSIHEDTCVARADLNFTFQIETPGRYYLVADTWSSGSSLEEYPGPYELTVEFVPAEGGGNGGDGGDSSGDCTATLATTGVTPGASAGPGLLALAGLVFISRRRRR